MRRHLALSGALAALITVLAPALTLPATAAEVAPACSDAVVEDNADVLDDDRIERAADAFGDEVTVKVISYVTTDGQDIYDRIYQERQRCHGWSFRPGGGRSLLVLAVATQDGRQATHYDGMAQSAFAAVRRHAEADGMGASFGNARWTRGMLDGLAIYARAYERGAEPAHPGGGSGGSGGSPVTGGLGDPGEPVDSAEPADASPWLLVLPGALVAGGAGWGGWALLRRRRATRAARAALSAAVNDLAAAWVEVDKSREYVDARVGALPSVDDAVIRQIRSDHAGALARLEQATATYLTLSQTYAVDKVGRLDRDEADAGVEPVTACAADLRAAHADLTAAEEGVTGFERMRDALPEEVGALRAEAQRMTGLLERRRGGGYRTGDLDGAPSNAEQAARDAEGLGRQLRFGDASHRLAEAAATLAEQTAWLEGLDDYRAALAADLAALEARTADLDAGLGDARVTLEHLEATYDPSCVAGIRDRFEAGRLGRTRLGEELAAIRDDSSMSTQAFRRARDRITAAQQSADTIATDAAAAGERERELSELTAQLPLTAQRVVADAAGVRHQIEANATAITYLDVVPPVAELESEAARLGERAQAPRAPLLALRDELEALGRRIRDSAGAVTAVIAAYDDTQRVLGSAAAAVAEARDEVDRSDVGMSARATLADAEQALARAESAQTLDAARRDAESARDLAHEATARARRDRRDAEQRRAAARRASSGSGGSSFFGGGGGGGFGGGSHHSSGGGGSSSFGGGGGGSHHSGGGGSSSF